MKICAMCGGTLVQRENEKAYEFYLRKTCSITCANKARSAARRAAAIAFRDERRAKPNELRPPTMADLCAELADPEPSERIKRQLTQIMDRERGLLSADRLKLLREMTA